MGHINPNVAAAWVGSDAGWQLKDYEARDGYRTLRRILDMSSSPDTRSEERYVVCNSDSSEPGVFKDRDLLRFNPHAVIEGMILTARSFGATRGYIYIHGEIYECYLRFAQALEEARAAGYLGRNILGSGFDFDIFEHQGGGSYICGDKTALFESIEGRPGRPKVRMLKATGIGLYGKPTAYNTAESYAMVPSLMQGSDGIHPNFGQLNSGYKTFSISGQVNKPGNYRVLLGTPFSALLEMAGGMRAGRKLKAVLPSGPSSPILPADIIMDCSMDYKSLGLAGSSLGSGAVIVMDETVCMVKSLERLSLYYARQSCGQCSPCREGTGWLHKIVQRIENGTGRPTDIDELSRIANNIQGLTICPMGYQATAPIASFLQHFRTEFAYHVEHKTCLVPVEVQRSGSAFPR